MSERESFEAWFSEDGKYPHAVKRSGEGYLLAAANSQWEAWQASREALKDGPTAGDEWIACADRMPNEGDLVTVCDHGIDVYPAVFSSGEFYEYSDRIIIEESTKMSNPTHWIESPRV